MSEIWWLCNIIGDNEFYPPFGDDADWPAFVKFTLFAI
jgi:hypothetical protein